MRNANPYTFSIYSNGSLVENVYGSWAAPESTTRGCAYSKDEALRRAQNIAEKVDHLGALSVNVFFRGRIVALPGDFNLRELTIRRRMAQA
jgi:hypothetical protein